MTLFYKPLIVILLLSIFIPVSSYAQTGKIKGAYAGCTTKQLLDEFITAASKNDLRHINALLYSSDCINLDGLQFSIVDRGFVKSQIRVYVNNTSLLLWTVTEATR
ncbi:MAG: hypothetical protein OXC62_09220 [Aestuariivita sp.]|nr:hypothetical protein [Aestuariivita sp.]